MRNRTTCEYKERCGTTGHYMKDGKVIRCPCLEDELLRRQLGQMYSPEILATSPLAKAVDQNLVLEGPISSIRRHAARALIELSQQRRTWISLDAYRLIEIFLGEDKELDTQYEAINPDLLILLLGFSDPRNRYLPELILQVLSRRELLNKPTWVILGVAKETISTKYSSELAEKLQSFRKAGIR